MTSDFKIIITIVFTLVAMFATSLLLDVPLVQALLIRQIIIYLTIAIQFLIGFVLVKFFIKN